MSPMLVTLPPSLRKTGLIPALIAISCDAKRRADSALMMRSPWERNAGITSVPRLPPPAKERLAAGGSHHLLPVGRLGGNAGY